MAEREIPDSVIRRLRANLSAAQIPITDQDLEGMIERGFLQVPLTFEEFIESVDTAIVPDYLNVSAVKPTETAAAQDVPVR